MKNFSFAATLVVVVVLFGCKNQGKQEQTVQTLYLNAENSSNTPILLSEIADSITYVPLETIKASLLSMPMKIIPFGKNVIIVDDGNKSALMFSSIDGHFIAQIGKKGDGPQDYNNLEDVSVDGKNGKIYLCAFNKIQVFNADASFSHSFKISPSCHKIQHLSGDTLALFTEFENRISQENEKGERAQIFLYNAKTGEKLGEMYYMPSSINSSCILKGINIFPSDGKDVLFFNVMTDTVYSVKDKLTPSYVLDFGGNSSADRVSYCKEIVENSKNLSAMDYMNLTKKHNVYEIYSFAKMKNSIFLSASNKSKGKICMSVINTNTKSVRTAYTDNYSKTPIYSDIDGGYTLINGIGAYENDIYCFAGLLTDILSIAEDKMTPSLQKIKATRKDDDNPVLAIIHMKKHF